MGKGRRTIPAAGHRDLSTHQTPAIGGDAKTMSVIPDLASERSEAASVGNPFRDLDEVTRGAEP
jgi:hypothetical protein